MTVDPSKLLQMLEPAVRPGKASALGGAQQAKPAFENRSFDDLLSEAKATAGGQASPVQIDPLGGLGQIENAALRAVLAQSRGSGSDQAA